jgi:uncharacterized OB-fold protein
MGLTIPVNENDRLRTQGGDFPLEHLYTVGVAGERCLRELKDHGRLLGTRCSACQVTYAPARLYCERCLAPLAEWVPIPLVGTVVSHSVVHQNVDGDPLTAPVVAGLIALDGANGVLLHLLGGTSPDRWKTGARVTGRLKPPEARTGSILDIEYFEPGG